MDSRITPAVVAAAQDCQRRTGIWASITVAQWALESGYGAHQSGLNNCFGIKAVAGQACTTRTTQECVRGKWVTVPQHFADYPSLSAGFDAHARLLATGAPYAEARKLLPDPAAFGAAMARRYATDPNYWPKLAKIIAANGLYSLDAPPKVAPAATPAEEAYLCKVCGRSDAEARAEGCGHIGGTVPLGADCPMEAVITSARLASTPAHDVEDVLAQRAAERAAAPPDPKVAPTIAPASASAPAGLLAHLAAWLRGRPAR